MSDSLQDHGLQHARLPCLPSSRVCSDICSLHQGCHPTISSSVTTFSSYTPLFPASGSFPMSWLFTSGSQNIGDSALHQSFQEYSWLISFTTDWFGLLAVQGTLKSLFQHHSLKASMIQHSSFFMVQISHLYMTTGKTRALILWTAKQCLFFLIQCLDLSSLFFQGTSVF